MQMQKTDAACRACVNCAWHWAPSGIHHSILFADRIAGHRPHLPGDLCMGQKVVESILKGEHSYANRSSQGSEISRRDFAHDVQDKKRGIRLRNT